ncbi:MAG: hypothetical protein MJ247_04400 [Alphaproteobacteria bacterium]|nr:hypothetical protein [Alphaproteobacteria bacterium]
MRKLTMKKIAFAFALVFILSPIKAHACNPLNPICWFQMILKATPGLPVLDIAALPAVIPHVPAALQKKAQTILQEQLEEQLQKIRSGQKPSLSGLAKLKNVSGLMSAKSEEAVSVMEAFPALHDSKDPLEIAKTIEKLFIRPREASGEGMSESSRALLEYYRKQFELNNMVDALSTYAIIEAQMETLVQNAEEIQNKMGSSSDLNQSQRANFDAQILEYQLMVLETQLQAVALQMDSMLKISKAKPYLNESILGN